MSVAISLSLYWQQLSYHDMSVLHRREDDWPDANHKRSGMYIHRAVCEGAVSTWRSWIRESNMSPPATHIYHRQSIVTAFIRYNQTKRITNWHFMYICYLLYAWDITYCIHHAYSPLCNTWLCETILSVRNNQYVSNSLTDSSVIFPLAEKVRKYFTAACNIDKHGAMLIAIVILLTAQSVWKEVWMWSAYALTASQPEN